MDVAGFPLFGNDLPVRSDHHRHAHDVARPVLVLRIGAKRDVAVVLPGLGADGFGFLARQFRGEAQYFGARPPVPAGQRELVKGQEVLVAAVVLRPVDRPQHVVEVFLQRLLRIGGVDGMNAGLHHAEVHGVAAQRHRGIGAVRRTGGLVGRRLRSGQRRQCGHSRQGACAARQKAASCYLVCHGFFSI